MPKPLLALMERPGSARFLVMEGMLTDPLKPARLSCTRTFWFRGREDGGEDRVAVLVRLPVLAFLPWAGL